MAGPEEHFRSRPAQCVREFLRPCKRTVGLRWFARQHFPPHGSRPKKIGQPGDRKLTHKPPDEELR